jgi:predicted Fe-Mo cluster-binding NifX family protein
MNLAIPTYKDELAPCFEAANHFQVFVVENGKVMKERFLDCRESGPIARLRLLKRANINILLCNGIRSFYKDMLEAENRKVFKNLSGKINDVLALFLKGGITSSAKIENGKEVPCLFELGELVELTREFFASNGYVIEGEDSDFPVDIIAAMKCPRCKKRIRVAVCCGGHIFSWEKEIRELRSISDNYDAAVYVHAPQMPVIKTCRDFNINLLDPWILENPGKSELRGPLPILEIPVRGHEAIYP